MLGIEVFLIFPQGLNCFLQKSDRPLPGRILQRAFTGQGPEEGVRAGDGPEAVLPGDQRKVSRRQSGQTCQLSPQGRIRLGQVQIQAMPLEQDKGLV